MKISLRKIFVPALLVLLSALLVMTAEILQRHAHLKPADYASRAEKKLATLEKKMTESLKEISMLSSDSDFHSYFIHRGFQDLGFTFFYAEHEKITRWSDNETDIVAASIDTCESNSLIHLGNGWYEIFTRKDGEKEITGLLLIRKEYAYENQYLVNSFNPVFQLPLNAEVANDHESSFPVHSVAGKVLFHIHFDPNISEALSFDFKSWLYIFSFLIFLLAAFLAGKFLSGVSAGATILFILILVAARAWMIHLRVPDEFYATPLFSPQQYASSFYFNSLGDLLLNTAFLFCITGILYTAFGNKKFRPAGKASLWQARIACFIFIFLLTYLLHTLISGLVVNSKISFDASNIFALNVYSITGFLVITVLLWSYGLVGLTLLKIFFHSADEKIFFRSLAFSLPVFLVIYLLPGTPSLSLVTLVIALPVAMLFVLFKGFRKDEKKIRLNFLLWITLLFSVYSSLLIWQLNGRKEMENRKLLAQKIETGQDRLAEYLFEDLGKKINHDVIVEKYFKDTVHVHELVTKRLMQFYFTGYWSKFSINVDCFNPGGFPFDSAHTKLEMDSISRKTEDPQLHLISSSSGEERYVSVIAIADSGSETPRGYITVLMTPKMFQPDEGFPELFVSRKVAFNKELGQYSYAHYRNDSLLSQHGTFAYYFSVLAFNPRQQEYFFVDLDGYNHLLHRISDHSFVVVSKSKENFLVPFTLFSYLFSAFSLLLLLFYAVWRILNRQVLYQLNLTRRIQTSVLVLVILSFALIGSGTVYYITHKYETNKESSIRDEIIGLLTVVEKELADASTLTSGMNEENQAAFTRLSEILSTDFNLYNRRGDLRYSSQPKIVDQGIISAKMNPEALFEMRERGTTLFVHPESIGRLNYLAAYEPLRNRQGKVIGYLHLPYFEKQNELNKEISNFLSALINIYVLLFALAVIVTLLISSRITQPLALIQEKLGNIGFGRKNERIEYRRRDEIGELVNEYNRMIEELEASSEKLARSERESAWREMAKQVAHEIKNPLTPMKLSVQHLHRAWQENSPQLNEIFQRISGTLIQQIDSLSNIATEFSNFAQMPQAKKERVDLGKTIVSTIDLFKELPDTSILFSDDGKEKIVFADREQLVRVFSNLLKNATQAIPSGKKGMIKVSISSDDHRYIISISDNGIGIPADQLHKMFTPSFTTKSGGMGLGLSIVKSIVETSGGRIWFETKEGEGTSFYVELPMDKSM